MKRFFLFLLVVAPLCVFAKPSSTTTQSDVAGWPPPGENWLYLDMEGVVGSDDAELFYNSDNGAGKFIQYYSNGTTATRNLRLISNGKQLIFDAYYKGKKVSRFVGTYNERRGTYVGTITNNKGWKVNFSFHQVN